MYQLGDVLSIQLSGFKHYGMYVGDDAVIHSSKTGMKVEQVSLARFSDNKSITISSIQAENPVQAIQNAQKYIGLSYNLFSENCEHFVRTACGLIKESTQIQKYLIAAAGASLLLTADNPALKAFAGAATVASLLTPSEKSPIKTALTLGTIAAAIALLTSEKH